MLKMDSLTNCVAIPPWHELVLGLILLTILTISLSSTVSIQNIIYIWVVQIICEVFITNWYRLLCFHSNV